MEKENYFWILENEYFSQSYLQEICLKIPIVNLYLTEERKYFD